jgi:hypothetical protein
MARITKADKVAVMGLLAQRAEGYPAAVLNKAGRAALLALVNANLAKVGTDGAAVPTEAGRAWLAKAAR